MKRKIKEQEEAVEEEVVCKVKKSKKKKKEAQDVKVANNLKTGKQKEEIDLPVCEDAVAEKPNKKRKKNKVKESAECAADAEVKPEQNNKSTKKEMEEAAEQAKDKKAKKKKKEKKKLKAEATSKTKEDGTRSWTLALEYLKCWSERREEWKFQKARQVWLLQNMYDREKVSDSDFSVLLKYLEGLQGAAREVTTQKAEDVVRQGLSDDDRVNRAREVVQILS